MFSHQQQSAQSKTKAHPSRSSGNQPFAAQAVPHPAAANESFPSWDFSKIPLDAPSQTAGSTAMAPWASSRPPVNGPRLDLSAVTLQPLKAERTRDAMQGDGSLQESNEDQDSLRPSVFEQTRNRRGVHVRVLGGHPGPIREYPDGIRWVQTIDTNKPLFGQTPPYVDFVPPKDDKPFYFSDAMEASQGGTFSDSPTRRANDVRWDATLSLVGVSGRSVTRIDSMNYGFAIDPAGALTVHGPSATGAASVVVQGDTLRSEYPDWIFSGGFAVPQVPAGGQGGGNTGGPGSGLLQACRPDGEQDAHSRPALVPPIVRDVIHSAGEPLHEETRGFMEAHFHHDFSRIRVHADAAAAESAAAVGASAYTVGRHVVFGDRQYAPGTLATKRLLAHELRHVQQQGEGVTADPFTVAPSNTDLERDADRAARRAVSGGAGAGDEIPHAARVVQRQPLTQPAHPGGLRLPELGESLGRPRQPMLPGLQLGFHLLPEDRQKIESYLTSHRLAVGQKFQPTLDGTPTTIDAIVNGIAPSILPLVPRSEIETMVQARYSLLVHDALFQVPITIPDTPLPNLGTAVPPGPRATPQAAAPITLTAGVNYAWHVNLTGPRSTSKDKTLQLQIGEDAPLQRIFQISYNLDTQQVQVVVGGQATADLTLVDKLLKLSGFVQVLAGVAWTGTPGSGMFTVVQPSAGGQLTLTWRGVQFAVQVAGSVTAVAGQPTTAEVNVTPQITIPLGGESKPAQRRTPTSELTGLFEVRDWVDSARYSEIERLPVEEKARLAGILLRDVVIDMDVDAVARIWRAISDSPMQQQQIRRIIEERMPTIDNPAIKARLQRLLAER